ncbi:MAG: hypothetical protein EOO46_21725 [Flavobacterium sp.]|nr:MAG: hypothetical protein EOO46_21725 [Flavobacterium sp.]
MEKFAVIQGDGFNPIRRDSLPSIIHMDIPKNEAERIAQEREVIEHDRFLRGFRRVILCEVEQSCLYIERSKNVTEDFFS